MNIPVLYNIPIYSFLTHFLKCVKIQLWSKLTKYICCQNASPLLKELNRLIYLMSLKWLLLEQMDTVLVTSHIGHRPDFIKMSYQAIGD